MNTAKDIRFAFSCAYRTVKLVTPNGSLFIEQHLKDDFEINPEESDPLIDWYLELIEKVKTETVKFVLEGNSIISFTNDNYPKFEGLVEIVNCKLSNPHITNAKLVNIEVHFATNAVFEAASFADKVLKDPVRYHNLIEVTDAEKQGYGIQTEMYGSHAMIIKDNRGGELIIHHSITEEWADDNANDTNPVVDLLNDINENIKDGLVIFELSGTSHLTFTGYHAPTLLGNIKLKNTEIVNCICLRDVELEDVKFDNTEKVEISKSSVYDWHYRFSGKLVLSHCFINEKYSIPKELASPESNEWFMNSCVANTMW